jgi:hypothetical protein
MKFPGSLGLKSGFVAEIVTLALWMPAAAFAGFSPSPWDKGQAEINPGVRCPIRYPGLFEREREQFAYNPRFLPGQITFTSHNRPVIRIGLAAAADVGQNKQTLISRAPGEVNLIQHLDANGSWRVTDSHVKAVKALLKADDDAPLAVTFGERTCDAVEIDAKGNAYTLVTTAKATFLAVSTDGLKTFTAVQVPYSSPRLEPYRVNADRNQPPPIIATKGGACFLVPVKLENGGTPKLEPGIELAAAAAKPLAQTGTMAGDGAPVLTAGGKSFFAFMSTIPAEGLPGSPQYIVDYDHQTGKTGTPLLLGSTGHEIDGHNLPVIDIDSKGHIHVIAGAHWHAFKHFVSLQPLSVAGGFRELAGVGTASSNKWSRNGLSYPGFVIDAKDTLHIIARGRSQSIAANDTADEYNNRYTDKHINYALLYFRGTTDGKWETRRDLVIPAWSRYGNFYHKLALDRKGGLHATYYYYTSRLWQMPGALKAYQQRWPEETIPDGKACDTAMKAHDPVILSSHDGGTSWAPATTPDFTFHAGK